MIGLEDLQVLAQDIDTAHSAGARLHIACEIAGIDLRTLQRWKGTGGPHSGRWQAAGHAFTTQPCLERDRAGTPTAHGNEPRFAAVPPARIVPMLADDGVYLASESSFSRVLREQGQNAHRGRAKKPRAVRPPTTHIAAAPRGVVLGHDLPAGHRDAARTFFSAVMTSGLGGAVTFSRNVRNSAARHFME